MSYGFGSSIDYSDKAPMYRGDVQSFFNSSNSQYWQTWNKPAGVTMVHMTAIAGGGGGGGGHCRAAGNPGGGGAGGACSGIATLLVPAIFLPDVLYVQVGSGGAGGTNSATPGTVGGAGGNGSNSYVSLATSSVIPAIILASGANAPGGGGGGTSLVGGTGGAVPTVATIAAVGPIGKLGVWPNTGTATNNGYVGLVGAAATTSSAGVSVSNGWNVIPFTPGAGGGGQSGSTDFNGGAVNIQASLALPDGFITANGIVPGPGQSGNPGIQLFKPFLGSGGAGGGSSATASAGHGGKGAIGCGGGGGGSGVVSGMGGAGGPGAVIIVSW